MKRKIFITIPIMLIIVCIFNLNVFANEPNYASTVTEEDAYAVESEMSENTDIPEAEDTLSQDTLNRDNGTPEFSDNVFALMFEEVKAYFGEILCLLTFISSIVVAFAYKKGLLPLVEGGLSAINRALNKIKEKGDESDKELRDNYKNLASRVTEYENTLTDLSNKVGDLTLAVAPFSEELKNNELIEELIVTQTKLLYDVFMASSMPAYQKDRVEAHYKEMMRGTKGEK